ncbi:MAG: hypothetical protein Q9161_007800 [Pseudevernia consocians]
MLVSLSRFFIHTHFQYSSSFKDLFSTTASLSSRYITLHQYPKGSRDARPTALNIIKHEGLQSKLTDKVVLIIGCSSGLGIETAIILNTTGAKLFLGVRNTANGQAALSGVQKLGHVELLKTDLNSLDSLLKPTLLASSTPSFNSCVVSLSSSGHRDAGTQFDDHDFENGDYADWITYGQSKRANIYMANEIEWRYGAK